MLQFLKTLLGVEPSLDFAKLVKDGAQIIDVRTPGEYQGGHIRGSVNIPLQDLESRVSKLNKDKAVITCCASGMRSASAKRMLVAKGFTVVHNGGGWQQLQAKLP